MNRYFPNYQIVELIELAPGECNIKVLNKNRALSNAKGGMEGIFTEDDLCIKAVRSRRGALIFHPADLERI